MKKLVFIIVSAAFLIISCAGTKPIKVDNLDSEVFTVNHIVLTSNTIEPSDEELVQIFQSLPYEEICDLVEEKTGIVLDMYYFDDSLIEGNIEYTIVYDVETEEELEELPEWELNLETEEQETQFCELFFRLEQPDGFLSAKAVMHTTQTIPAEKEGKEDKTVYLQSTCSTVYEKWTYKSIFVDQRSCGQIKFHKNIEPIFIENELYSVYSVLNKADNGYTNVNINKPVEIRCNIKDPGNLFFSPTEIYNVSFEGTFKPDKQYYLKYKLKRTSPDSHNWKVIFVLKEVKPKLTK